IREFIILTCKERHRGKALLLMNNADAHSNMPLNLASASGSLFGRIILPAFRFSGCVPWVHSIGSVANQLVIIGTNLANSAFLSSRIISALGFGFIGVCTDWKVAMKRSRAVQ